MSLTTQNDSRNVSTRQARVNVVQALEARKEIIARIVPEGTTVERLIATVGNAVIQNPDIARADPANVFTEVSKAARDGLVLDGREAALVPYKGKVTYIPMIAGIRKRAFQSGLVRTWVTGIVYEKEYLDGKFRFQPAAEEPIYHEPIIVGDRGPIVAAYSIARMTGGEVSVELMRIDQLEGIRRRSPGVARGPWQTDTEEMYRKTVARRHAKSLPLGDEFKQFIDGDASQSYEDAPADDTEAPAKQSVADRFKEPERPAYQAAQGEPVIDNGDAPYDPDTGEVVNPDTADIDRTDEDVF